METCSDKGETHRFKFDANDDVVCEACGLRGSNGSPSDYERALAWAGRAIDVLEKTAWRDR